MRIRSIVKLAALLLVILVVVVVGLLAAVKSLNLERVKDVLTAQVQSATGRTLTITGPLKIRPGLIPRVVANGVTLSNRAGSAQPDMATIKRFEMEIALLPLLKHEILINRLILLSPDIVIETDANGPGNLDFSHLGRKNEPPTSEAVADTAYRFSLREVQIEKGVVTWLDRSSGRRETVAIDKLSVEPDGDTRSLLAVQLVATIRGHVIQLDGTVGGPGGVAAATPLPVKVQVHTGGLALTIDGTFAHPVSFSGLDFRVTAQGREIGEVVRLAGMSNTDAPLALGPFKLSARLSDAGDVLNLTEVNVEAGKRQVVQLQAKGGVGDVSGARGVDLALLMESDNLAALSPMIGTEIPAMGPMHLSGQLRGGGTSWTLSSIKATLAGSDMNGDLAVDMQQQPRISGQLSANTLIVDDFTAVPANASGPPASKPVASRKGDGRIFSDHPLPVQSLRTFDVNLALQIGKLKADDLQLADITADMRLEKGVLSVKPFRTTLAGGRVEGDVVLDATGTIPTVALRVDATQVELGKLTPGGQFSGGKSDVQVDLKGQGASVRALMASSNGATKVRVGAGRIQNTAVNWAGGDLLFQLLGALNPLAESESSTILTCAAARFLVRDGIATANDGIGVRTAKVDVMGSGTVDLRSERLDLGIRPRARSGVGLSLSTPLTGLTRIQGTLTKPTVGIDPEGSLRTAATVGAVLATGGLSVLGELLVDKVAADIDPCATALGERSGKQAPRTPKQSADSLLKGLFGR